MTEMSGLFAKMKSQFVDKGIPVILGEYGAMVRTGLGEIKRLIINLANNLMR